MSEAVKSESAAPESDDVKPARGRVSHAKEDSDSKKEAEDQRKAAEEQAERDEADIETFLSAHRGEQLARGDGGSFVHEEFVAKREAEREHAEDETE